MPPFNLPCFLFSLFPGMLRNVPGFMFCVRSAPILRFLSKVDKLYIPPKKSRLKRKFGENNTKSQNFMQFL